MLLVWSFFVVDHWISLLQIKIRILIKRESQDLVPFQFYASFKSHSSSFSQITWLSINRARIGRQIIYKPPLRACTNQTISCHHNALSNTSYSTPNISLQESYCRSGMQRALVVIWMSLIVLKLSFVLWRAFLQTDFCRYQKGHPILSE